MMLRQVDTVDELRVARAQLKGRVGLALTMGALHAGHLALVQAAREDNDSVIATIFVNPTQFAPGEDLAAYPRNLDRDLDLLEKAGIDLVFTPSPEEMYPAGYETSVNVEFVSTGLEGDRRPGHFKGVATVVAKFFNMVQPDTSYFGQKDAQQVVVLRRMVRDLNFPVDIVVIPTHREQDGLALSSRNAYLNMAQREAASVIYRALRAASDAYAEGERLPATLRMVARAVIETEPLAEIDYIAVNDPRTLYGVHDPTDDPLLLSLVVKIGKPRLLDNCLLPWSLNDRDGLTGILGV
jgi:pantoate--beta-alanine ligase